MIITTFLMSIESKVSKAEKNKVPLSQPTRQVSYKTEGGETKYKEIAVPTQAPYEKPGFEKWQFTEMVQKPIEPATKSIEKKQKLSLTQKIKGFAANLVNVPKNAIDTTIGLVDAKYLNWQSARYLKKNPDSERKVLYMMHGVDQTIGSQRKLARQARDQGYLPYLLRGKHSKGPEWVANDAFKQIDRLHNKAKIKEAYKRNDKYTGHSSGGNVGLYMATDERINKYGIKEVHAVAPTPHGIKIHTLGQKLISKAADISSEDITTAKGRETVKRLYKKSPNVPVYITAGRYDNLVPPQDAVYLNAKGMHIIDHPDSTHFGTSGVNEQMNKIILDLINHPEKYKHMQEYYKKVEKQHQS